MLGKKEIAVEQQLIEAGKRLGELHRHRNIYKYDSNIILQDF
jgi:hypothetical protein